MAYTRGMAPIVRAALRTDMRGAVWECRIVRGMSAMETAQALGVTTGTVYSHLKAVVEEARKSLNEDVERWKLEQNSRYDHIYSEAIGAWEESKKDKVKQTKTASRRTPVSRNEDVSFEHDAIPPDEDDPDELKVTREPQVGDPRYLAAAITALNAQGRLWGFNAPESHQHNIQGVVVNVDATNDAVIAAEQAYREARFTNVHRRSIQAESGSVVPEVREDHPPDEGENPL